MNNIAIIQSQTAGILCRYLFNLQSYLISLSMLLSNSEYYSINIILIILSIKLVSSNSQI